MKWLITLILFLFITTVYSQTYSLFDKTIQSSPQPKKFNTLHNHNNEFYIVIGSDYDDYNRKFFYKFDTLGNVIHKKVYYNNEVSSGKEEYNTYLWEDSTFYNFTLDDNKTYYFIAFNYNFDTLWKKEISIPDTTYHKLKSTSLAITRTIDNDFLLNFNVYSYLGPNYTPSNAMIVRTDQYGNFKSYHVNTSQFFLGRKIAFTQDSCFLSTCYLNNNKLNIYDMNASIVNSIIGVNPANYQFPLSYDILFAGDGKYFIVTNSGSTTGDPFHFIFSITMIDYANKSIIWRKTFTLGNESLYPSCLLTLNKLTSNKFVLSGTSVHESSGRSFHFVFNKQGDSLFFRKERHQNQSNCSLGDVIFLDSMHVLGVGRANAPWIFKKQIDLISSLTQSTILNNDIELFPNPATSYIQISPKNNWINEDVSIEIINSSGKIIIYYPNTKLINNYSININSLSNGVYYMLIKSKKSSITKSFIIK